ncbi:MAG: hypothetical protein R3F61_10570 [Myxococcota bacterium]
MGEHELLVPRPSAYALLKLLAYVDRRAPRDLRDLGYVTQRHPFDPETIWEDAPTRDRLADQTLVYDDLPAWFLGRDLRATFDAEVVREFRRSLSVLASLGLWHRGLLVAHEADPERRIERADRLIRALIASLD